MGVIDQPIQKQAFEYIRDQIAYILADELYQQSALQYDDEIISKVYRERFVPLNATESPCVNICFDRTNYSGEARSDQDGICRYTIDCYYTARAMSGYRADQLSKFRVHKMIGIIRAILMDRRYVTLGFAKPFISNRRVVDLIVSDPVDTKDMSSTSMARIIFEVRVLEQSLDIQPISDFTFQTQVLLGDTDLGYVYDGDPSVNPGPLCSPVSVLINSVQLADIDSGGSFNVTIVDSNGDEQGVTSELTSMGVKVTVPASSSSSIDIDINGQPFLEDQTTDVDIEVTNSTGDAQVGSEVSGQWRVGDTQVILKNSDGESIGTSSFYAESQGNEIIADDVYFVFQDNQIAIESTPSAQTKNIEIYDSDDEFTGDVTVNLKNNLVVRIRSAKTNLNGNALIDNRPDTTKNITIEHEDGSPVVITTVTDTEGVFEGTIPNVVDPSKKVYYNRPFLPYVASVVNFDEGWLRANNIDPDFFPADGVLQQLDLSVDYDYLKYFNKWGHKFRLCGLTGGYYDFNDSQYKDVNGNVSTFEAQFGTPAGLSGSEGIIQDLLTGLGWRATRGGTTNQDQSIADVHGTAYGSLSSGTFYAPPNILLETLIRPDVNDYLQSRHPFQWDQNSGWTSTTILSVPTQGLRILTTVPSALNNLKTGSFNRIFMYFAHARTEFVIQP